jgi:tRNA dimethylallyltransferase
MATVAGKSELPLIVIVGPTASGKSSLAMRLADEFNGEIISADSRAIFKGLDIGTAKPTPEDQKRIRHWGIDLVDPGEKFTVKDFQEYAYRAIDDIRSRGKIPFLVGGTGLYIDGVVYRYTFSTTFGEEKRRQYEAMSLEELYTHCDDNNISLPENYKNKRYVINTILRDGQPRGRLLVPDTRTYVVGITTDKELLRERIANRADEIVSPPVLNEAMRVAQKFGWNNEAMTGNIYRLITHESKIEELEALKQKFIALDWQLAKRQLTWFRRSEHIVWRSADEAYTYCARILAKLNNS